MKKLIAALLLTVSVSFGLVAAPYDYTILQGTPHQILPLGQYNGEFNLETESAFDSGNEVVTDAYATFIIFDLTRGYEKIQVDLGGDFFGSAENFGAVSIEGPVTLSLIDNNILKFTVKSLPGSLVPSMLMSASLEFNVGSRTIGVPDGGSMMALLGLSVLGLGWASRRVRA